MKKRQMEGDHLSREAYDAQDDDDESAETPGVFARASEEELATRRKLTLKKRDSGASVGMSTPAPSSSSFGNPFAAGFSLTKPLDSTATSNPFASTILTAPSIAAAGSSSSNPFKGFNQLTAPSVGNTSTSATFSVSLPSTSTTTTSSTSSTLPSFTAPSFSTTASASASFAPSTGASAKVNSSNVNNNSEYAKKMKKLNESFLKWAERQVKENAVAIWKDGVKDYLKHQEAIMAKYGISEGTETTATATKPAAATTTAAPVTAPVTAPAAASAPAPAANPFTSSFSTTAPVIPPPATSFSAFNVPPTSAASAAGTKQAPFSFSLPAPATATAAPAFGSSSFTFSLPPAPTTTTAGNAFAFKAPPAPAANTTATASAANDDNNGEDGQGDDEGEPILEPEKVLRNDQDTDTIVLEVACKLFNYNKADKEWKDTGKGNLRITQDPDTKKKRMVMRNGTGKIILNAAFFKSFKVERVKSGLKFSALVAHETTGETEFKMFMVKLNDGNAEKLKATMEQAVSELQ